MYTGSSIAPINYFALSFSVNENGISIPDPKPSLPKKNKNQNHDNDGWIEVVPQKDKSKMSPNGETASIATNSGSTSSSTSDDPKDKYKIRNYNGIMKNWIENGPNDSYGVIECKKFKGKENVEFFVHISELKFQQKEKGNTIVDNYLEISKAAKKLPKPHVTFQVGNLKKKALNVRLHCKKEGENNSLQKNLHSNVPNEEPTSNSSNKKTKLTKSQKITECPDLGTADLR